MTTDLEDVYYFSEDIDASLPEQIKEACERAGFQVGEIEPPTGEREDFSLNKARYDGWYVNIQVNHASNRTPEVPGVMMGLCENLDSSLVSDDQEYNEKVGPLLELLCRIAMETNTGYVPMTGKSPRRLELLPDAFPYHDSIERSPRFAIYRKDVLDSLGGIRKFYDSEPWYIAELTSGHTLVLKTSQPWGELGWTPPTDAEYIENATLHADDTESGDLTLGDPFADLEPGEYGADIVIQQDDLDDGFDNDTAELVRVYVDENHDLRRVEDDSFVRNVVTQTGSERELIDQMGTDCPPGVDGEDVPLSVLLNDQIPSSFVRLDDPTDENIVTLVMNLEISMSKYDVLMGIANLARPDEGYTDEELESIEGGLSTLVAEDDPALVEAWIRENIFE